MGSYTCHCNGGYRLESNQWCIGESLLVLRCYYCRIVATNVKAVKATAFHTEVCRMFAKSFICHYSISHHNGRSYILFSVVLQLLADSGHYCTYCGHRLYGSVATCACLQGFAESLQHDSSNQSEIVMIKLYCCGPDYCSTVLCKLVVHVQS